MSKIHISFLILVYFIANSNTKDNSYTPIKLKDLVETPFSMNGKDFIIFEYENKGQKIFNSSINFIFNDDKTFSASVCIYDSLDKIHKNDDNKFDGCLDKSNTNLNTEISYNSSFYRDNCSYYLVLYDSNSYYKGSILVVNSLKYINLDNDIEIIYKFNISLHFLIEKNESTYLHYQTKFESFVGTVYNISIINEKGEILLNKSFSTTSGYIEIQPNIKYYAHILTSDTLSTINRIISLNYEKYKNNILIKDENEINKTVLSSQNYTFFKDISNIETNESIILTISYDPLSDYEFYVKFYNSSNFESLVDSFPIDKKDFDYKLEMKGGYLKTEIKKLNETYRGILIGFFYDGSFIYRSCINKIHLRLFKAEQKSDEDDTNQNNAGYTDGRSGNKNSNLSVGWIIFIVMMSIIIVVIIVWAIIMHLNKKRNIQLQNELMNNYYYYNNNDNQIPDKTDVVGTTCGNNVNDNYYKKIQKNVENPYDNLSACPPIKEIN